MKNWLHAPYDEIDNMTFEEAKELIKKQIKLGHEDGDYRPREHMTKALEMLLERAEKGEKIMIHETDTEKETKNLISELTKDDNLYVNLPDLIERFVEVDEYYNHEPWNLMQILANINMIIPVKIN